MKYTIKIEKKAMKFIKKQSKEKASHILKAIYQLPNGDTKPIQGHKELYRLRVGDFRIIYTIDNGQYIICVIDANNRGDIYKRY
ncbi:type II toxin-antitoxin system RelE family toxin [Anaerosporobacter sp.]|uniref:type II toxin-antitoxin system RelE family toxin n=1 Tax=Anaerosporobacter sp. TaxID=1872529 RepID=UPI00286EB85D|nr:type II toxin-antitoxin system RelE/ParE family toxin [Anaerosporobacter sp.]